MTIFRRLALLLVIVSLVLTSNTLPAAAQQDAPGDADGAHLVHLPAVNGVAGTDVPASELEALVTQDVSPEEQAEALAFWTQERMQQAVSLDLIVATDAQAAQAEADMAHQQAARKAFGAESGSAGDESLAALAQELYPAEWAVDAEPSLDVPAEDAARAADYATPLRYLWYYTQHASYQWKQYPYRTMGKLFFKVPGNSGYSSCTASVAVGRAVWTAGHCVYTPGKGWHTNMTFVPAYRNGQRPYGTFTVTSKSALTGWTQNGRLAYDQAMVIVADISGKKVSQWVGWLGYRYNQSVDQLFNAFGMPSNLYSGQYLIVCIAQTHRQDSQTGPDPLGIGCPMTYGASGGPWLLGFRPYVSGSYNYVNGVNSYIKSSTPNVMYAAYFGSGAKALYDWGKTK